jgi:D-glycero-D-manno-heptose 1,7-bisphosphate phosphatase
MSRRAVFLDRDGTINVRPPAHSYVTGLDQFFWLPGARAAIARLTDDGYLIAVVSNQRGLARGLVSRSTLNELEDRIQRDLAPYGCAVTAFRYCPHDLDAGCDCRKPRPGLIVALAEELGLDLSRSWVIGDTETDVLAGQAAGCRTVLVGAAPGGVTPDLVVASLAEASRTITSSATSGAAAPL